MDNVNLFFDDNALDYIVDKAIEYKLGARGLRGLMETVMADLMFELPNKKQMGTVKCLPLQKSTHVRSWKERIMCD